jgi:adenylate cyclase
MILLRVLPKKEAVPASSGPASIAVLPFADDSQEKGHESLCEGIPNTLINALNKIQNLRISARTSSFSFVGKGLDIHGIGQKLNVDNVLEGSIQVVGNNLRVSASLIKVKDGYQLWNETYDSKLEDVFAIQDKIAQAIVKALKIRLLGEQEERLAKRDTENIEAYKLYLEGLHYWNKRTGKDLNKAIELFNQALDKDSNYALAHVGLADSYNLLTVYSDARPRDAFPRAKAAALKALEINETLAEAHNSLAYVYEYYDWNWKGAEAEFKRALALNPNYATAHFWYGELLAWFGRYEESIQEMKRALELDPVSLIINTSLGLIYYRARQLDQARAQFTKTLELDPSFALAHLELGLTYIAKNKFSEAIGEIKKAAELSGDVGWIAGTLGMAYAAAGKLEEAKGILEELKVRSQKQYVSPYAMARLYGVLGDTNKFFEFMNQAYEEKSDWLVKMKGDPFMDRYLSDPRYHLLLKKIGLE